MCIKFPKHSDFRSRLLIAASIAALAASACGVASADTCQYVSSVTVWTAASPGGSWNTAGNWSAGTPTGAKNACITNGTINHISGAQLQNSSGSALNVQVGVYNAIKILSTSAAAQLSVNGNQIINAGGFGGVPGAGILIESDNGQNASLTINDTVGNVVLSGGGTIKLVSNSTGLAQILGPTSGTATLENKDNLIEGAGRIDSGSHLILQNDAGGTVNANTSGGTLAITSLSVSNTGTLEASGGGTLSLATANAISNAGGIIKADGGTVDIAGEIDGGTLSSTAAPGSVLQTSQGQSAILNGVTIGSNSNYQTIAGASSSTNTTLEGTIANQGTFTVTAGAQNALLSVSGNVILTGNGTINLSSSGAGLAEFLAVPNSTLENQNNLIEGAGKIDSGPNLTFLNDAGGTVDANLSGQMFSISAGSITNNGLFEASNGGNLAITSAFTNAGQMQTTSGGSISVAPGFVNQGQVTVGQGTTFTANGNYAQTAGTTRVDGTLNANIVQNNGGTLEGTGTIVADLTNYGTIKPGDSPGTLTIDGDLTETSGATLQIDLAGTGAGQFGQLDVNGVSRLDGALALDLIQGFTLAAGDTFDIMNATALQHDFTALSLDGVACMSEGSDHWFCSYGSGGLQLAEDFIFTPNDRGQQLQIDVVAVPEPASIGLFAAGLVGVMGLSRRRRKSRA